VGVPSEAGHIDALIAKAKARPRPETMAPRPRLRTVILTCMDARIDPAALFDLKPGEVHVLRNAGALATPDVLRSLAVSQALLGTDEVLVVGHTECGLLGQTEEEVAHAVERASGHHPGVRMGSFPDLDNAVRESVQAIRDCEFLAHRDAVLGYVLDVKQGTLHEAGHPRASVDRKASRSPLSLNALSADVLNMRRTR